MGFFDRIFGKEKNEVKVEKNRYDLKSAEKKIKEKIDEGQKEIEPELRDFHKKLLELDTRLRDSLKKLDSAVPKERIDEKLLFAAHTGRKTFRNKILNVSEAISVTADFNFHNFSEYYNNCVFAANRADALAVTEFKTISIAFKEEGNAVVDNLRRLKELLSEIGNRIKRHQEISSPYEEALEKNAELQKLAGKLSGDVNRNQELENEIEKKNASLTELKKSVEDLVNSNEWKEYENSIKNRKDLETKEAEIRARFNEMISSVERPLRKAKRVIDQDQEENEHRKMFEKYIDNSFGTFLGDEKEEALNSFLETTRKLLSENKIDVNKNVREKSINKIDEWISEKVFEKMKHEYQSVLEQIEETNIDDRILSKKSELEKKIELEGDEILELKKKSEAAEKQIEENKKIIGEKKKEAEEKIGKLLNHHCELEVNY